MINLKVTGMYNVYIINYRNEYNAVPGAFCSAWYPGDPAPAAGLSHSACNQSRQKKITKISSD